MSLADRAAAARCVADASGDRGDIAAAVALEAAVDTEARHLMDQLRDEPDVSGIPPWSAVSEE